MLAVSLTYVSFLLTFTNGYLYQSIGFYSSPTKSKSILLRSQNANIPLENIANMRDVAHVSEKINKELLYRSGCISKASPNDAMYIDMHTNFQSLIDLRSPAELEADKLLHSDIYIKYQNYFFDKKSQSFKLKTIDDATTVTRDRKRFFVSLMSESLIKKGVFFGFRKRLRLKAVFLFALSILSRRAEKKVRSLFLDKINTGGLAFLNQLVLDASGKEIIAVLKLIADPTNLPMAIYCTAGKDRTGLIVMFVHSILGLSQEEILADYVLSDSAYKDMDDKNAVVAALKQTDVDPQTFLRAKPDFMQSTMDYIDETFGSVDNYLNLYGFDEVWREKLRSTLLKDYMIKSG